MSMKQLTAQKQIRKKEREKEFIMIDLIMSDLRYPRRKLKLRKEVGRKRKHSVFAPAISSHVVLRRIK